MAAWWTARRRMPDHRFTRRAIGITGVIALGAIGLGSLVSGNDGDVLVSVVLAIVAVVTVTLKGIGE